MSVRPVRTSGDLKQFIRVQWTINGSNPNWVPPLLLDRRKILSKEKNPFFLHSEAEYFLAERGGSVVGRIAAILNNNHNKEHGERIGFFGFFECVDDSAVAGELFDAARGWLRGKGLTAIRGPASPSVNDEFGLLVEGFDEPPTILMPYNPPFYGPLIEQAGLRKVKDLYAYDIREATFVSEKFQRGVDILKKRSGLTIRPLDMKQYDAEIDRIKVIYRRAWEKNWGAVPMTDEEFKALAKDFKPIVNPKLVLFVEYNGEPVGFSLTLPDLNQVFIHNRRGWLIPGLIRLFLFRKRIRRSRILVLGVLPERLKTGAGNLLIYHTGRAACDEGLGHGEAGWVLEDNIMMNRAAEFMNGTRSKVYRLYEMPL